MATGGGFFILITIILIICCQAIHSLRLTKINIPQYKFRGESAILECNYELNGRNYESDDDDDESDMENSHSNNYHDANVEVETLYSIKWYKDSEEFYRFVPKSKTPQTSYKVDGVKVDNQASNSKKVFLRGLTLKSTGLYRCEISAEEPDFKTVTGEGRLEVIYPATSGPTISPPMNPGDERQYQIGDILSLNCTSGRSQPRSVLTFYINDEAVADSNLLHYRDILHNHGLITTTLGLNLPVNGSSFYGGVMRVRCVSNLLPGLQLSGRESVTYRRIMSIENREAMLLVRSSSRNLKMPIALILIAISLINTLIV